MGRKLLLCTLFFVVSVVCQELKNIALNRAVYHSSAADFDHTGHLLTNGINDPLNNFWRSQKNLSESVYIDFGIPSVIVSVSLSQPSGNGAFADEYSLETSNNAKDWTNVFKSSSGSAYEFGGDVNISLPQNPVARFLRLSLTGIANNAPAYKIYQIKVFGTNNLTYKPQPLPQEVNNKQYLTGGNWKVQRLSEVSGGGVELTASGAGDEISKDWLVATVPSTVLVSYLNAGAILDPNYADQQLQISDKFFTADFWYYDTFVIPLNHSTDVIWLNFEGINWKAEIFFNGHLIGRIDGGFIRGRFEVTQYAMFGYDSANLNRLAVLIHANDNPGVVDTKTLTYAGKNGGVLGKDNPTFHASIGWDWIPVIRGRNIGIYNDVFLSYTRAVTIVDPWVETHLNLPDLTRAENIYRTELQIAPDFATATAALVSLTVDITVPNSATGTNTTVLTITRNVTVLAGSNGTTIAVAFPFVLRNPLLWYPNRYGPQNLYKAATSVRYTPVGGVVVVSDTNMFSFGVREIRYNKEGTFKIYINGKRIYCTGGNWGMDESMLRANNEEEYDIRVRLHKEAGFTIIRNWVGMTGNEWFYRMCDKYGILIHDDFWLANPVDGPNPHDNAMFLANARDKIKRVRKYASVAYYCGRNEGQPPGGEHNDGEGVSATEPLDLNRALREATVELDGSRFYIADSADYSYGTITSGHGPYTVRGPDFYFSIANENFHSERGLPNVPCVESIQRMLSPDSWWPISTQWGLHDFALESAQNGANFIEYVKAYGSFDSLQSFVARAQFVNYENYKAIFEAPSTSHGNAMLLWMSQSAWPSMVWQTYDYYFDTNAGFFGSKKGNQVVNPLYNYHTRQIQVVNNAGLDCVNLSLVVNAYNISGTRIGGFVVFNFTLGPDEVLSFNDLTYNTTANDNVVFLKTFLYVNSTNATSPANSTTSTLLADNFYWVDVKSTGAAADGPRNFTALSTALMNATVAANGTDRVTADGTHTVRIDVRLTGQTPALLVRLKITRTVDSTVLLPVYYSDNYFSLFAGGTAQIEAEFSTRHLNANGASQYTVTLEGFNVPSLAVAVVQPRMADVEMDGEGK